VRWGGQGEGNDRYGEMRKGGEKSYNRKDEKSNGEQWCGFLHEEITLTHRGGRRVSVYQELPSKGENRKAKRGG